MSTQEMWFRMGDGNIHDTLIPYVETVERGQSEIFDRFSKLAYLYDPHEYLQRRAEGYRLRLRFHTRKPVVSENGIASNVDTVTAIIAATEIRPRFLTNNAEWSDRRRARHREWYAEELIKLYDLFAMTTECFRDACLKGTGLLKIYDDDGDEIVIERTHVDDIVVDEREARRGKIRQMHQRCFYDKSELAELFPKHAREIQALPASESPWAGYRDLTENEATVVESWYLPKHGEGGRHAICARGITLVNEEWTKPRFPFAVMRWLPRVAGWYGLSLGERLTGAQRRTNEIGARQDEIERRHATPTTYVRPADANLAVKTIGGIGNVAVYRDAIPQTVNPPAVSPDTYARQRDVREIMAREAGVTQMLSQGAKPSGLDSGAALREFHDASTTRFALPEKNYERFVLDAVVLMFDVASEMGDRAPVLSRKTSFGAKRLKLDDLDMGRVKVQIAAASTISRTPAGRAQTALEWAQAGVISIDDWRQLMQSPDIDRAMSLYTSALDDLDRTFEDILDGELRVPEAGQNLNMGVVRVMQVFNRAKAEGAPETILEALRQWRSQAVWLLEEREMAAAPTAAAPSPATQPGMPIAQPTMPAPAGAAL